MEVYIFYYDEDRDEIHQYKLVEHTNGGSYYAGPLGWKYLYSNQVTASNNFFYKLEDLYKRRNELINQKIDQLMRKKVMDPKLIKSTDQD